MLWVPKTSKITCRLWLFMAHCSRHWHSCAWQIGKQLAVVKRIRLHVLWHVIEAAFILKYTEVYCSSAGARVCEALLT